MRIESLDAFRALASVAASENMDADLKEKAKQIMLEYMDLMQKTKDVELKQLSNFSAQLSGIVS